ncbi:MAG: bifunctional adenosylcobinamide kinase/adenosylcobinamide-phosphate guanylyltransferase [Deferribacteraceae bacterium]|nr:bifunctional adenosylcobinamide kinase/adenosylcobinamide-phosphate guanylyltransferase [Deferribacteraceae bacterium]
MTEKGNIRAVDGENTVFPPGRKSVTLITGGHGSGKTAMALKLAAGYSDKLYIATAEPIDSEMCQKIALHKAERGDSYTTLEVSLQLPETLNNLTASGVIVVDCLTVWLGNLLHHEKDAVKYTVDLCTALPLRCADIILITNESGLALIPPDPLSRKYLKLLTEMNKRLAEIAGEVCMMVSGAPLWLKRDLQRYISSTLH